MVHRDPSGQPALAGWGQVSFIRPWSSGCDIFERHLARGCESTMRAVTCAAPLGPPAFRQHQ
eukprot:7297207-Alexandrium_andersonii.AAC.1